jgi:hypothetical protein
VTTAEARQLLSLSRLAYDKRTPVLLSNEHVRWNRQVRWDRQYRQAAPGEKGEIRAASGERSPPVRTPLNPNVMQLMSCSIKLECACCVGLLQHERLNER